jgi:homoserine dehydrogenase
MASREQIGVVIVGCGTVGGAAAQILTQQADELAERIGISMPLRAIVDVDFTHARDLGLDEKLFCTDLDAAIAREDVQIVVELVGGTTIAKKIVAQAIAAGKHVVTANKALLAHHGVELLSAARQRGTVIAFEASCAGAIPIISTLTGELACDRIDAIYGIVNGTCNYILTAMTEHDQTYADALSVAQSQGLAEADPTLDVTGEDSAHKLTIMADLAFRRRTRFEKIYVEGIDSLEVQDINYGKELGYVVKLLAIARRQGDALSLRVHPAFISRRHPLAWVSGPFNAVSVYGENSGHTMYYGRGAGDRPTAAAVVGDIASVAMGNAQRQFQTLNIWPDRHADADLLDIKAVRCRYYIRLQAEDHPGVFAKVANILGDHDISISSVLQREPHTETDESVPMVITTYKALESNIRTALNEMNQLDVIKQPCVCIRMVAEHPEQTGIGD